MTDYEELPPVADGLGDGPSDVTGTVEQTSAAVLDGIGALDLTSGLANGTFAICFCLTRPTTTRRARTCP